MDNSSEPEGPTNRRGQIQGQGPSSSSSSPTKPRRQPYNDNRPRSGKRNQGYGQSQGHGNYENARQERRQDYNNSQTQSYGQDYNNGYGHGQSNSSSGGSNRENRRGHGHGFGKSRLNPNATDFRPHPQSTAAREQNGTTYYNYTPGGGGGQPFESAEFVTGFSVPVPGDDNNGYFENYNNYDAGADHYGTTNSASAGAPFESSSSYNNADYDVDYGQNWSSGGGARGGTGSSTYYPRVSGSGSSSRSTARRNDYGSSNSSSNVEVSDTDKVLQETGLDRDRQRNRPKLILRAPGEGPDVFKESKNQRDTLTDQLSSSNYECMVCCAKVFRRQAIWSCGNCFNVFHLPCIKKWVNSSAVEGSWRCPGCQNVADSFPEDYVCFCGKTKDPSASSDVPHSCMLICGKVKSGGLECTHLCGLQCHPGPCPSCTDQVSRKCECGKKSAFVQCSNRTAVVCGSPCEKALNCGVHFCPLNCHAGPCQDCAEKITLECHCKRNKKEVFCTKEANHRHRPPYTCLQVCDSKLNCKNHKCPDLCHPDQCRPCPTSVDMVISCPCGQTSIAQACAIKNLPLRKSCLDPIPTCGKICKKILTCGGDGKHHRCESKCHLETPCPPCGLTTTVKCRCGGQETDVPCKELLGQGEYLCAKKCAKKRSCGRHKCNTNCCIDPDHVCPVVCDKPLRCGNHRCESLCHIGHCHPCPNVSFEELRCECGAAVIYPPVACGTKPPPCARPCGRQHPCDHPVVHNCHTETNCPPCSFLTEKWCFGKHEMRKNIPCHTTHVSCGMACGNQLSCGRHKCPRVCHPGPCQRAGDVCTLACLERRKICGHSCGAPCHEGGCPDTKCKQMTEATCGCGRRKETLHCWKREIEFDRVVAAAVAAGINGMFIERPKIEGVGEEKAEMTVETLTACVRREKSKISVLDCDKECARIERNRKMAQALQLENPDVETRLGPPNYTEFCKKYAQKYPQFVEFVHTKLTDLVMQVKRSKKLNQTFAFDSMNRDKRQLIHEYSDHFGVVSESFDEEPNRNVIVTASKEKSWLPSVSLIDAVFRQNVLKTDRKNVHQDLELVEPTKTQIIGPANRRLIPKTNSKMVFLNGSSS